jgi:hypothetical protein
MAGGLVGKADEIPRCQRMMIKESTERDGTLGLLHANFDSKAKNKGESKDEEFIREDQIDDMIEVTDNKERDNLQKNAGFIGSRFSEVEVNQAVQNSL